jgi:hypothetical protein
MPCIPPDIAQKMGKQPYVSCYLVSERKLGFFVKVKEDQNLVLLPISWEKGV